MSPKPSTFKMGRLDHVHIRVPDRAEAARWYAEYLGFEPVTKFDFWATGFDGGPLQISARTTRTHPRRGCPTLDLRPTLP
ncbi:MAG: hypothetical protein EX269_11260 [Acidimicrobiales bacterium]|nr:MAG: hypothetical protein EX269_11260 [Acidimicrobiales bacterium]